MYQVKLPIFEGPFDLLLHLIKKEELNIYDIPVAKITKQYLEYLTLMEALDLEIASEFLVIAAMLLSIKSRMLLPKHQLTEGEDDAEEDPRLELTKKLIEYKKYKEAADKLGQRFSFYQQIYTHPYPYELETQETDLVECDLFELLKALQKILKEKEGTMKISVSNVSLEEKMEYLQKLLAGEEKILFFDLFKETRNKMEVVTTFLALLELIKLKKVCVHQHKLFSEIWIFRQ
ncbi:MAG: segregation/condensation protein A [bacterium]|nr:segregation/condensation protein A [bacterium]